MRGLGFAYGLYAFRPLCVGRLQRCVVGVLRGPLYIVLCGGFFVWFRIVFVHVWDGWCLPSSEFSVGFCLLISMASLIPFFGQFASVPIIL